MAGGSGRGEVSVIGGEKPRRGAGETARGNSLGGGVFAGGSSCKGERKGAECNSLRERESGGELPCRGVRESAESVSRERETGVFNTDNREGGANSIGGGESDGMSGRAFRAGVQAGG